MTEWLGAIAGIIGIMEIGLVVEFYGLRRRTGVDGLRILGLGLGAIAIFQILMGIGNLPVSREAVLVLTGVSFLPVVFDQKLRGVIKAAILEMAKSIKVVRVSRAVFWGIVTVLILMVFSEAVFGHDAYSFWLSKARAFFVDSGITTENIYVYWPYDHPLLWPLVANWYYQILGVTEGYFVRLIPFIGVVLIGKRLLELSRNGWAWAGVFLLTPFIWQSLVFPEHSGNADLLTGIFIFSGIYGLIKERDYLITGIFFGLAALTKNDALPILVTFLGLAVIKTRAREGEAWRGVAAAAGFLAINLLFRVRFGLENRYAEREIGEVLASRPLREYMTYTLHSFREEWRQVWRWGLGWWVIIFSLVTRGKEIIKDDHLRTVMILLLAQLGSLLVIYYITPEDQASHIASSLSRILSQTYGSFLLLGLVATKKTS